jgi:hypothetical protein
MGWVQVLFGKFVSQYWIRRKGNMSSFLGMFYMFVLERKMRDECWKNSTYHDVLKENHCLVVFYVENEVVGL